MSGKGEFEGTRSEMARVRTNLSILEQLFLMLAALTALLAGALVAWLLLQAFGLPFRPTWAVASLALFIIPGAKAYLGLRREERAQAELAKDNDSGTSS